MRLFLATPSPARPPESPPFRIRQQELVTATLELAAAEGWLEKGRRGKRTKYRLAKDSAVVCREQAEFAYTLDADEADNIPGDAAIASAAVTLEAAHRVKVATFAINAALDSAQSAGAALSEARATLGEGFCDREEEFRGLGPVVDALMAFSDQAAPRKGAPLFHRQPSLTELFANLRNLVDLQSTQSQGDRTKERTDPTPRPGASDAECGPDVVEQQPDSPAPPLASAGPMMADEMPLVPEHRGLDDPGLNDSQRAAIAVVLLEDHEQAVAAGDGDHVEPDLSDVNSLFLRVAKELRQDHPVLFDEIRAGEISVPEAKLAAGAAAGE